MAGARSITQSSTSKTENILLFIKLFALHFHISYQGESRRTTTSGKTVGVLGSDIMSSRIVNNLLTSGHKVVIWNRDPSESKKFKGMGAGVAASIGEVVKQVDIIFSYLSDWLDLQEV